MKAHRFSCMSVPPGKRPFNDDFEAANCATVSEMKEATQFINKYRGSRPVIHVPPLRRLQVRSQTSGPPMLLRERCDVTRSLTSGNSKTQTLPKITYSFELLLAMSSNLLAMASNLMRLMLFGVWRCQSEMSQWIGQGCYNWAGQIPGSYSSKLLRTCRVSPTPDRHAFCFDTCS